MPKTGVEIRIGAIIYMMIEYPKLCALFDEKISLLDFRNKNLNNTILTLVSNFPEISSRDLKHQMTIKGFTVQINNFMQSNYPKRLNYELEHLNEESMCNIFRELLSLLNLKKN